MGEEKKLSFTKFCEQYGVSAQVVQARIKKGWTVSRALKTPVEQNLSKRNKNNRRKGRLLEKHVAAALLEEYPEFDAEDIHPVASATSGIDIILSKYARKKIPISFECKTHTELPLRPALAQASKNMYPDTVPCVVWKKPNTNVKEAIAILKLTDLFALLKLLESGGNRGD